MYRLHPKNSWFLKPGGVFFTTTQNLWCKCPLVLSDPESVDNVKTTWKLCPESKVQGWKMVPISLRMFGRFFSSGAGPYLSNKQVQVVESYPKAFCAKAPTCQTVEREEKGHKNWKKVTRNMTSYGFSLSPFYMLERQGTLGKWDVIWNTSPK